MKLNKWLNFAGVLNIIVAILMFFLSNSTIIAVIFLLISGFFYRDYFNKEGPDKRKISLIIFGIFNLLFNFVSGVIVLEVAGLIKDNNYDLNLDNKNYKINSLLQLGVVLVLLSGIMIATNQTVFVPNIFKVVGLMLLSFIFFFLSHIGKNYLKMENSFKTYYILGMSFVIISFLGLYYYGLLGSISINSIYYLYFYPLLFLLIGICSYISEKVLKINKIQYITIISSFLVLITWFQALNINIVNNALIMTFIISLINFIYNPSCEIVGVIKKVNLFLSYVLIPINMIILVLNEFNIFSCLLTLITTLNIFHIMIIKQNKLSYIISLPTLILNSLILVCKSAINGEISIVFFQIMMIVFYYLIKFIEIYKESELFNKLYRILFNIVFILTSIVSLFISSDASLVVTFVLVIQNIIDLLLRKKEEIILEPIKTLLFIISLMVFINSNVSFDLIFNLFIIEIIQLLIYIFVKNDYLKKIHYILYLILIGLISILSVESSEIFLVLISLISAIIPLIVNIIKREENIVVPIFTSILLIIINSNIVFEKIYYLNYLISFILMIVYAFLYKEKLDKKYILLFSSSILYLNFINMLDINYDIYLSFNILGYSYIGVLISSLIKNKNKKDMFISIYFAILCIFNIFYLNIYIFITISLITIMLAIFGFIKDFKKVKIIAIILFILNLIYQLNEIWNDIPIAIYLLIIGLVLIGVVIVKEIKENK